MAFLFIILISCGRASMEDQAVVQKERYDAAPNEAKEMEESTATDTVSFGSSGPVVKNPEKIIKTANINFRVEDYSKSRAAIERIVRASGGYISSENEQKNSYSINNSMVIRIPNSGFDSLVERLSSVAMEVNSKTVSAEDVTAQFVDIQARLKTKKEIESRYIDLLDKANKISDILEIEEKIREIREEIEAKEGQLKYLGDQVAYSTVHLDFYQTFEYQPSDKPGFFNRLGSAFGSGWKGLLEFIVGFVYLWPLWLIISVLAWGIYRLIRRLTNSHPRKLPVNNQSNKTIS